MGRKLLIVLVASLAATVVALAVLPATASSSGAGDPRIAILQKQVKALQKQVKTLQTGMKNIAAGALDTRDQLDLNFEGDTCLAAQMADLIQGTWGIVDQMGQALQQKTYFGAQTPLDDYQNCADLAQPDVPRPGISATPTIEPLRPLEQWLHVPQ